jgi:hypothetical protein
LRSMAIRSAAAGLGWCTSSSSVLSPWVCVVVRLGLFLTIACLVRRAVFPLSLSGKPAYRGSVNPAVLQQLPMGDGCFFWGKGFGCFCRGYGGGGCAATTHTTRSGRRAAVACQPMGQARIGTRGAGEKPLSCGATSGARELGERSMLLGAARKGIWGVYGVRLVHIKSSQGEFPHDLRLRSCGHRGVMSAALPSSPTQAFDELGQRHKQGVSSSHEQWRTGHTACLLGVVPRLFLIVPDWSPSRGRVWRNHEGCPWRWKAEP